MASTDPRRQLALLSEHGTDIFVRIAPLTALVESAMALDPDLGSAWRETIRERREGIREQIQVIARSGAMRPDVGIDGAADMLPGTISAADRYVRLSYNLKSSPKYKERHMAVAAVFSQMRSIGVPLGMADPDHPNISATLWRSVADHDAKRFYFESTLRPSVFWARSRDQ